MGKKAQTATVSHADAHAIPVSLSAMLVTLGVVYGDIGTSPMYVTKALVAGNGGITSVNQEFILGALSLVIWTVTLLTTIKYVLICMKADNHGEGGIFALYSLVRRFGKWLIIPAMLGGAALLADGILTPAVTVTTAVEGLRTIPAMKSIIGPGQTNRITALELAIKYGGENVAGSVLASDAFFPFDDCVEAAAKAGVTAIIQPGGSMRDEESIQACDDHGIAMVFTGARHFRH